MKKLVFKSERYLPYILLVGGGFGLLASFILALTMLLRLPRILDRLSGLCRP